MFSDLNRNTLPRDIPSPHEDPLALLNFDDLLDIAQEFEFASTITHIWPCEELSTGTETGLEDILGTIVPAPNPKESPLPLPDPASPRFHAPVSMVPAFDNDTRVMPSRDDDQPRTKVEHQHPIKSMLWGWSPPDGSQFLDLDDPVFPQSTKEMWISPLFATFLAPTYPQSAKNDGQLSPPAVYTISNLPSPASPTESKPAAVSTTDEAVDDRKQKAALIMSLPEESAILDPVRVAPSRESEPNKAAKRPQAKSSKSRAHPASTGEPATVKYAKAPRGGIPPHIARSVTKANIIRIEKERKVMQTAFSNTAAGEGKKPSVLLRARKAESVCEGGGGKKPLDDDKRKEGRAAKRARV